MSLLMVLGCLVFAWWEAKNAWRWYKSFRGVQATKESDLEALLNAKAGDAFEFNAQPLVQPSRSPVTKTACAAWEFEVWQEKADREHGHGQKLQASSFQRSQTFYHQCVFKTKLPEKLEAYVGTLEFRAKLSTLQNLMALEPAVSTAFCEYVIPHDERLHVFGHVMPLEYNDIETLKEFRRSLGLHKPLMPWTLGGEDFAVALKDERSLLRRTALLSAGHSFMSLLVFVFAVLLVLQRFDFL